MSYVARPGIRERQLIYGPADAGKSTLVLSAISEYTAGHIHIMDSDDAWDFMLHDDEEATKVILEHGNFTIHNVDIEEWDDDDGYLFIAKKIEKKVKKDDIVVVDKHNPSWQAVQNDYDRNVFGLDHADFYEKMRKQLETKREEQQARGQKGDRTQPLYDSFRDWGPINSKYTAYMNTLLRIAQKAHVFLIADSQSIGDTYKHAATCRPFGCRPSGQGDLMGWPHTVLLCEHDIRAGRFEISQVKDRASRTKPKKRKLDEKNFTDKSFIEIYLAPIAGWSNGEAEVPKPKKKKEKKTDE